MLHICIDQYFFTHRLPRLDDLEEELFDYFDMQLSAYITKLHGSPVVTEETLLCSMTEHLGQDKTTPKIATEVLLTHTVRNYCKQCRESQNARGHRVLKAPLIPFPVVGESFERMPMDLLDPLPQISLRNKYSLAVCDYCRSRNYNNHLMLTKCK